MIPIRINLTNIFQKVAAMESSDFLRHELVSDMSGEFGLATSKSGRPADFEEMNQFFKDSVAFKIREAIGNLLYKNIYTTHVYDIYTRESEIAETDDYDSRKKNGQIGGWSSPEDRLAFTAKKHWFGVKGWVEIVNSKAEVRHTLLHEFGHQFSKVFSGLENMGAFRVALDTDIKALGGYDQLRKEGYGYFTPSKTRPDRHVSESWAELSAVSLGTSKGSAKHLAEILPNASKVVDCIIKDAAYALDSGLNFYETVNLLHVNYSDEYRSGKQLETIRQNFATGVEKVLERDAKHLMDFNEHLDRLDPVMASGENNAILRWVETYIKLGNKTGVRDIVSEETLNLVAGKIESVKPEESLENISDPRNAPLMFLIEGIRQFALKGRIPLLSIIEESEEALYIQSVKKSARDVHAHIKSLPDVLDQNSVNDLEKWIDRYIDLSSRSMHAEGLDSEIAKSVGNEFRKFGFDIVDDIIVKPETTREHLEKTISEIIKVSDEGKTALHNFEITDAMDAYKEQKKIEPIRLLYETQQRGGYEGPGLGFN